ncbi:hypothetical protein [Nodosilinea nodulosa]|uniref:hypothetical protein n=1 Tax=Nodosilinea nodulosa TaxID=416001 RepID=UPI0003721CA1|nr:hypothetical protein [Nodosilinea nodulosa]
MNTITSKIRLYHATQLSDFETYLKCSGVLCREDLEAANPEFTKFFSDDKDKTDNNWNRTFGNFADFGARFANFDGSVVPNAYGPICIVFIPGLVEILSDFKATKISVATDGYEPDSHLISLDELPSHFEETQSGVFPTKTSSGMEFSCANRIIEFTNVAYIIVDAIDYNGSFLPDIITEKVSGAGLSIKVMPRKMKKPEEKQAILSALLLWAATLGGKLLDENEELENSVPDELKGWLKGLNPKGRGILASWLTYIYSGTLRYL